MPAPRVRVLHQNIFFKRLQLWNQMSYISETHLQMTTRARAFFLLKNILLDFLKTDSKALVYTLIIAGCLEVLAGCLEVSYHRGLPQGLMCESPRGPR